MKCPVAPLVGATDLAVLVCQCAMHNSFAALWAVFALCVTVTVNLCQLLCPALALLVTIVMALVKGSDSGLNDREEGH